MSEGVVYLEVIQELTEEESLTQEPQMYRRKVASKDEAKALYAKLKELGVFDGFKPYVARVHVHRHGETNQPCEIEVIEKVE